MKPSKRIMKSRVFTQMVFFPLAQTGALIPHTANAQASKKANAFLRCNLLQKNLCDWCEAAIKVGRLLPCSTHAADETQPCSV